MRYSGSVYRPPSEAHSLIVQCTLGCSHNKCAFCNMYKEKKFSIRSIEEVMEDLEGARRLYRRVERVFLGFYYLVHEVAQEPRKLPYRVYARGEISESDAFRD